MKVTPAGSTGPSPSSPLVWSDLQRTLLFSLAVKEKFHELRTTGKARTKRNRLCELSRFSRISRLKIYKGHSLSDEEVKVTPAGSTGPSPSSPLVWSDLQSGHSFFRWRLRRNSMNCEQREKHEQRETDYVSFRGFRAFRG